MMVASEHPMQRDTPQAKRCGAKTQRGKGPPCQNWAMPNGRCRQHGGMSPGGIASGTYKTGRYSKYLPARLLDRYNASADDPELLNLREDIALVETQITEMVQRIYEGSGGATEGVIKAWNEVERTRAGGNALKLRESLATLGIAVAALRDDASARSSLLALMDQKRKLTESERKRQVEMQQLISAEQAMLFVSALQDSVRRHVTDRKALQAIAADMAALSNRGRS